ncbi:uncharacterized protein LOC119321370 [Triticum dicoccoides]|uniref:uncharacterized protein LOC119321370 n=1 Tax=Triticum dicoccoides TaxID=85692 RepID=UPI001891F21A|nr:uncharacterized protein LOC119321370 [Triticum dicoccoides]
MRGCADLQLLGVAQVLEAFRSRSFPRWSLLRRDADFDPPATPIASPLLRSSAAILRRSNPRAWTFPRRPAQSSVECPRFLSAGAGGVVEPKACCVAHMRMEAAQRMRLEAALEKFSENLCVMEKDIGILLEHERRFERRELFHKRLPYVLIPGAIFVFCPDKKREPSTEGQSGV